jgi:hypothetical protein
MKFNGTKTIESLAKPSVDATWDSVEGEAILEIVKSNLTPYQVAVLAKYKELYPTGGMAGFDQIMKKAEGYVNKKW